MDIFFGVFALVFVGVFAIVAILILVQVTKGVSEWSQNNSLPEVSVPAKVTGKRTGTSGHLNNNSGAVATHYFATFELASGERLEFTLSGRDYGLLAEQDLGVLTHQGTRFKGFQRELTKA